MGIKDKKTVYYEGLLKNLIFRVGSQKKYIGGLPKKGGLGQFEDLRGGLAKKKSVVFLRGVDTQMHVMGN